MDSSHPSLGHQFSVACNLANHFESISVLTTHYAGESCPSNVEITVIPWKAGKSIFNAVSLLTIGSRILLNYRPDYVFSHMAPLNSIVLGPITRLLRIRHCLWYAHAHNPKLLRIAVAFVNAVISSTRGSFPIKSDKLKLIGQGVDSKLFRRLNMDRSSKFDFTYAGRMDTSKNVHLIIDTLDSLRLEFPEIRLTLIGNESEEFVNESNDIWITAKRSIKRDVLPSELDTHGAFIHAFIGSLDKVLVEAVMMELPVISINPEFMNEFLVFSDTESNQSLYSQARNYMLQDSKSVDKVVNENLQRALKHHELQGWINRLVNVITTIK